MPLVLTRRDEPIFPFRRCCCMDNRMGTFFGSAFVLVTALLSLIFVSIDQYAVDNPNKFQINGGFSTKWRTLQYASWKACNVIMICAHLISIIVSFVVFLSIIRRKRLYEVKSTLMPFNIWIWMYIIIELGIICFEYTWYTWHVFRLPWTCFIFVFWFVRMCVYMIIGLVTMSYNYEINDELRLYDETETDKEQANAALFQPTMPRYPSEPQVGPSYPIQQRMAPSEPKPPFGYPPGFTSGPPPTTGYGAPPPQPGWGNFGPPQPTGSQQFMTPRGPPATVWQQPAPAVGSMQSLPSLSSGVPNVSFGGMQVNPNTVEDDF